MEIIGNRELTYLYAAGTPFAIQEKNGEDENMYYLHLDYQGSIRAITNEQGNVVETRDYDACSMGFRFLQATSAEKILAPSIPKERSELREGRPRNATTLEYTATNPFSVSTITNRGYTFHEHIFEFSLINMNARMYDPVTRRVISPDNYIQAPDNTQSFNRYSYCWNNPLKYTDPDGNIIFTAAVLIAAPFTGGASLVLLPYAIGADLGGTINAISNSNNINSFGEFAASYGAGAFAGSAAVAAPVLGAAVGGAILSGTNNAVAQSSGDFKNVNWGQVGTHAIIGGVTGAVGGAVTSSIGNQLGSMVASKISNQALKTITHRTVQFAVTGGTVGFTNSILTAGLITNDYSNVWESTWKGFAWGALGGAVWGGIEAAGNHANKINAQKGIKDQLPDKALRDGTDPYRDWISSDPSKDNMVEYLLDEASVSASRKSPYGTVNYNLQTPWYDPVVASYRYYAPQLWKKISLLKLR